MKRFIQRLFQARQLIGQDLLAGLRFSIGRALLLTGIAAVSSALLLVAHPDIQGLAQRTLATSLPSLALVGAAQAADLAAVTEEAAATAARDIEAPGGLLVGVPNIQYGELGKQQQAAALFLARKYDLAPDAIAGLVSEAYRTGKKLQLDPLLILAVMSIESRMNPFAQSAVGAQGLMQVMTTVHAERFEEFGGPNAALNPVANIRVGAQILRDLHHRFGTTQRALKAYVGATDHPHDAGYGLRVLTERARLEAAVTGLPFKPPVMQPTVIANTQALPVVSSPAEPTPSTVPLPSPGSVSGSPESKKDGSV